MSNELEPSLGELADHPLISKWEIRPPFYPGDQINRLRVTFTNGRGASIIYGGMLMMDEGIYEIAAINTDGELDYTTDVIGSDVLKGDARDIVRWVLALANLPAEPGPLEGTPLLEGEVLDTGSVNDVVQNLLDAVQNFKERDARRPVPGEVIEPCCPGGEAGKCTCPEKHPDQPHCPTPGKELAVRYWEPCVFCVEAERVHPTPESWDRWERIRLTPEAVTAMAQATQDLSEALKEIMGMFEAVNENVRSFAERMEDKSREAAPEHRGVDVAGAWIDETHDWAYPDWWDVPRPTKSSYTANFILTPEESEGLRALMGIDQLPDGFFRLERIPEPHRPGKPVRYWGRDELLARVREHWNPKD